MGMDKFVAHQLVYVMMEDIVEGGPLLCLEGGGGVLVLLSQLVFILF